MTFEQWWNTHKGPNSSRLIKDWAERAWYAAKENSKPIAKISERTLFGGDKEYHIIGFDGFASAIRNTKEAAEKWAIENGYRILEK